MIVPTKPDFLLNKWKYMAPDKFPKVLHNILLHDESQFLINWCYDMGTGQWGTVFFKDAQPGPEPVCMILHNEDENGGTKLLFFEYIG